MFTDIENPNQYPLPNDPDSKPAVVATDPQFADKYAKSIGLSLDTAASKPTPTPEAPSENQTYVVSPDVAVTTGSCLYLQDVQSPEIVSESTFQLGPAVLQNSLDGKGQIIRVQPDPDCWDNANPIPDGQLVWVLDGQVVKSSVMINGQEVTVYYVSVLAEDPATKNKELGWVAISLTGIASAENTAFLEHVEDAVASRYSTYDSLSQAVTANQAAG